MRQSFLVQYMITSSSQLSKGALRCLFKYFITKITVSEPRKLWLLPCLTKSILWLRYCCRAKKTLMTVSAKEVYFMHKNTLSEPRKLSLLPCFTKYILWLRILFQSQENLDDSSSAKEVYFITKITVSEPKKPWWQPSGTAVRSLFYDENLDDSS